MFGPNAPRSFLHEITYHHRGEQFSRLYLETVSLFREKFNIPTSKEIIFVTGSGTTAINSVLSSINVNVSIGGCSGKFKNRLESIARSFNAIDHNSQYTAMVHYETSESKLNDCSDAFFLDCTSSFPFYDVPSSIPIWSTVSSKLLGAAPVLGIVVIDEDVLSKYVSAECKIECLSRKRQRNPLNARGFRALI